MNFLFTTDKCEKTLRQWIALPEIGRWRDFKDKTSKICDTVGEKEEHAHYWSQCIHSVFENDQL